MIRPFRAETERYGHYSVAGESVWDHPFLWGSKRTGPDLARVGGRYSDDWHRAHLYNPRNVVPESKMPAYPFLVENKLDGKDTAKKMEVLRTLGVPYTDEDIAGARSREGQDRNGRAGGLPARPWHHHQKQTVILHGYRDDSWPGHRCGDGGLYRPGVVGVQPQAQVGV
jgi:cbb3-type cytochrome c oxidase subunit II